MLHTDSRTVLVQYLVLRSGLSSHCCLACAGQRASLLCVQGKDGELPPRSAQASTAPDVHRIGLFLSHCAGKLLVTGPCPPPPPPPLSFLNAVNVWVFFPFKPQSQGLLCAGRIPKVPKFQQDVRIVMVAGVKVFAFPTGLYLHGWHRTAVS